MACNFNIDSYESICADVSGVAAVSLIPAQNVTAVSISGDVVQSFTYISDEYKKWAQFDIVKGKGTIALQNTIDPKKQVFFNAYTLTFNLDSFNAKLLKHGAYLTGKFLAMVKLNNGKIYLLGKNGEVFNDLKITQITSTTGAALGDAAETVVTMVYRTTGMALECNGETFDIKQNINQVYDTVKTEAPAAAAAALKEPVKK